MVEVKELIHRLSKPMWLDGADKKYTWAPDSHGVFNIYYLLTGKPTVEQVTPEHFHQNYSLWQEASNLAANIVAGVPVEMTATVLPPKEFLDWLDQNKVSGADRLRGKA